MPSASATSIRPMSPSAAENDHGVADLLAPDDARGLGVIARALLVLDSFGGRGTVYGISELARRCGLPKSTTFRMVNRLVESGYVRRHRDGFSLSHHMFKLSNKFDPDEHEAPTSVIAPHLGGLFLKTGFAVNFAILSDTDVIYLSQIQGPRVPRLPVGIGGSMPATATALGKAMLAFSTRADLRRAVERELPRLTRNTITNPRHLLDQLKTIREQGVAFDHQEAALGLVCVAAPVVVPGRTVTAVSVCGPSAQLDLTATAKLVRQTVDDITDELLRRYGPDAAG